MSLSLYTATVPFFQQMLGSVMHLIDKAEAWCKEQGVAPAAIIEARLAEDMFPFGFQVKGVVTHSKGTFEALRRGVYTPDRSPWPDSFDGLRGLVAGARAALDAVDPAELDRLFGNDARFEYGDFRMDFTAEDFLLSFAQPNFYFHVSMVYAILRMKGLAIGKLDYLGALRLKV